MYRPEDAQALADALTELLRNPERCAEMGRHGRDRAQYFSWDRVSQQVLTYYERLIYERAIIERPRADVEAIDGVAATGAIG